MASLERNAERIVGGEETAWSILSLSSIFFVTVFLTVNIALRQAQGQVIPGSQETERKFAKIDIDMRLKGYEQISKTL